MAGAKLKDGKQGNWLPLEESNLVEFPLCYLADNPPDGLKTLIFRDETWDKAAGESVPREVTITAADAFGLPNWFDQDVLLALMVHTFRQNGFRERAVSFSIYELNRLLGQKTDGGRQFNRIALSLDRWCGTTIKYKNAWRKDNRWVTETFHILDNVKLTNSRDYDPDEEQIFKWNDSVVESIQKKNTKEFDWEFYKSLKNPTAKRLFRFLDKRFWHRRRWDFSGVDFAKNKIGVADGQPAHRYKERLKAGSKELVQRGFIKEPRFEKSGKGRFRVYFEKIGSRSQVAAKEKREPTSLEQELLVRGVKNGEALIAKHGENLVREQIENFDFRLKKGEELGNGWLGSAIARGGYGFRKDYISKEKREANAKRVAEKKRIAKEREQLKKDQEEKKTAERKKMVAAELNRYSEVEREEIFQQALAANTFYATRYRKVVKEGVAMAIQEWRDMILESHICGPIDD